MYSPESWRVNAKVAVGAVAQWSEHLQLKQEALGSIPGGYPGLSFSWPTNVDEMKICGTLV